jgi:hypothetical protein
VTRLALLARHSPLLLATLAVATSCVNDEPRTHVFRSSPPPPASATSSPLTTANANVSATIERPIGATGPAARVTAVRVISTGAPARLELVSESVEVVTLVSRGRGSSPQGPARIELRITGALDTTVVERLETPVPIVVSHAFRVSPSDGSAGLPDGRYELQVRLLGPTGRQLAASVPLFIGVRRR